MASKRKRSNDADEKERDSTRNKRFAYLQPRVRRISERTIKSRWTTLPDSAQAKIRDMLSSLERPVIMRQRNDRKRVGTQAAVQAVVRNLGKRLSRVPFPPVTKDSNFEYEAVLDEHRSLKTQLATVTDSIDLLKAEIEREEALLANETRQFQDLEKNAKATETERKRQMKNEHPVLQRLDDLARDSQDQNPPAAYVVANTKNSPMTLSELGDDPDITRLITQLQDHLQSMQRNAAPLSGLRNAIARSQAALNLFEMSED
ncbi:hypothetical protein MPDQ_004663 [Monascus purpureus]|uniref:Kinetochore protein fta7 n=1 Tax=Monascus purpureus TaxID=5098 RepID=A0A507QXI1_MONPU|nr:hypothetical protein MPDQ_004663 [Monascus purpureus]BDD60757.1 hypothetical protein MAP00_005856 [Monascus purpureus]